MTGCCTACEGTGISGDPQTNGLCWDCYGTGHCHPISNALETQRGPGDLPGPRADRPSGSS